MGLNENAFGVDTSFRPSLVGVLSLGWICQASRRTMECWCPGESYRHKYYTRISYSPKVDIFAIRARRESCGAVTLPTFQMGNRPGYKSAPAPLYLFGNWGNAISGYFVDSFYGLVGGLCR